MPASSSSPALSAGRARQLTLTLRGAWPFVPFPESDDEPRVARHAAGDAAPSERIVPGAVTDSLQLALELP
jgi:hypothetical protein